MRFIGITGPSSFTCDVIRMVENFFEANPILLYMDDSANLNYWLDRVDGVFLCGGVDIHPMTYDRSYPSKRNMKNFDLRRDRRELKIIDRCILKCLPMFGICRGHQLLGVHLKRMALVTDLCEQSTIVHCPSIQEPKFTPDPYAPIHKVAIEPGRSLFGQPYPKEGFNDLWVNSFHHQGLLYQAHHDTDNTVIGTSFVCRGGHNQRDKYIIELMENPQDNWISCQWHPEYDYREQESSMQILKHFKEKYLGYTTESEPLDKKLHTR